MATRRTQPHRRPWFTRICGRGRVCEAEDFGQVARSSRRVTCARAHTPQRLDLTCFALLAPRKEWSRSSRTPSRARASSSRTRASSPRAQRAARASGCSARRAKMTRTAIRTCCSRPVRTFSLLRAPSSTCSSRRFASGARCASSRRRTPRSTARRPAPSSRRRCPSSSPARAARARRSAAGGTARACSAGSSSARSSSARSSSARSPPPSSSRPARAVGLRWPRPSCVRSAARTGGGKPGPGCGEIRRGRRRTRQLLAEGQGRRAGSGPWPRT